MLAVLRRPLVWLAAGCIAANPVWAQEPESFTACLTRLEQQAQQQGLPQPWLGETLTQVKPIERVIELDRSQPEFTQTFADYFYRRVSDARIAQGRQMLQTHQALLQRLQQQYGVPAHTLLAFWGLETNYGSYLGKMPILDALATLACDTRRSAFFEAELITALGVMQQYQWPVAKMRGSWAGAMGHTQFMPSAVSRYAVDGDGDGQVDLWGSIPDALTSAANYLQQIGWQREQRWGREVVLPDHFDYALVGLQQPQSLDQWRRLGVTTRWGHPLSGGEQMAALLLPSGYQGPAFLVYDNFSVIMRWNRSEFYALSVGHMADRIAGAAALRRGPPQDQPRLYREQVRQLQERLNRLGFDAGEADGILGSATRQALRRYQLQQGWIADGYPHPGMLEALDVISSRELESQG